MPRSVSRPEATVVGSKPALASDVGSCASLVHTARATSASAEWPTGALHGAAAHGDVAGIERAIALGAPLDPRDAAGRTPLAWAILAGASDTAAFLIDRGADLEARTAEGMTPLMLAARGCLADVTERLLLRNASPNGVDRAQRTALMLAARGNCADVVSALLTHGAAAERRSDGGMTALMHAAEGTPCVEAPARLIGAGAEVDARDGRGATALLLAVHAGHLDVARLLVERGARLDVRDKEDYGALDYVVVPRARMSDALHRDLGAVLAWLVSRGVDRRLGLDPTVTPILFRAEIDAAARREPVSPPPRASEVAGVATPLPARRAVLLLPAVPPTNSMALPSWLWPEAGIRYRSWTQVPNIVEQVVVRGISPLAGQRLSLAGDARGTESWEVDDVLFVAAMIGPRYLEAAFAGTADRMFVGGHPVHRFGAQSRRFAPGELDVTSLLSLRGGADRVVLSVLDYGGVASVSPIYLCVTGPAAEETIRRVEVERVLPPGRAW